MIAELFNIVYNYKEKRFRGSFVTLCSTLFLYGAYSLILFLVYYTVYVKGQPLDALSGLILGTFASISGVHAFSSNSYYSNKTKEKERTNRYARSKQNLTEETQ